MTAPLEVVDCEVAENFLMFAVIHEMLFPKADPRWWETVLYKKRNENTLLLDLKSQEISGHYKTLLKMSSTDFECLLNLVGPRIVKKNTIMRESISVQNRLAVTLRFLNSGDSYTSLQYLFKISKQALSSIIPEVCEALVAELKSNIKVIKHLFLSLRVI